MIEAQRRRFTTGAAEQALLPEMRGPHVSQAIVDPGELRRFAHNLERFSTELEEQMLHLRGQLNGLGQSCATRSTKSSSRNSSKR